MNNLRPDITEPTQEEIQEAIEKLKTKYNIDVSSEDAAQYAKLSNELGWWLNAEKKYLSEDQVDETATKEAINYVKKTEGDDISPEEASIEAEKSLISSIPQEKDRLANEIRALIAKYK